MGYYANGKGYIVFQKKLSEEEMYAVEEIIAHEFEYTSTIDSDTGKFIIDFWNSEKYHGEEVEQILNEVSKTAPISEGEINYIGEDDTIWRYIYRNSKWCEENGRVIYESDEGRISIPLTDNTELVAEVNKDSDYKEIFIGIEKNGQWWQDLCFAREAYVIDESHNMCIPKPVHGKYEVAVYGDKDCEDYTELCVIDEYKEKED